MEGRYFAVKGMYMMSIGTDETRPAMTNQVATLNPTLPGKGATRQAQVLYDGACPLCRKSVDLLRRLDWLHRLSYVDARDRDHLPPSDPPLNSDRLLQEMHLLPPRGGQVYHGFKAFRWMAWRLPPLWPLLPFLYLPGMASLGQRVYLWVARNRFRLVPCHGGVCTLPGAHKHADSE
jgi:predicted DCC family thiol-disulfide oxidoreductase YuxK